jgi:glycerophosphoryl diester phosphodiesterase
LLRKKYGVEGIHLTSFFQSEILEAGLLCPEISRSIIFTALPIYFEDCFRRCKTHEVSLFRGSVNEALVKQVHAAGICARIYSVNFHREAALFESWGVEGIFTDDSLAMQPFRRSDREQSG